MHFKGRANSLAVQRWARQQIDRHQAGSSSPDYTFLLAGDSAGSLATQLWSKHMIKHFAATHLMPDSMLGIVPKEMGPILSRVWRVCSTGDQVLDWPSAAVDLCYSENAAGPSLFLPILQDKGVCDHGAPILYIGSGNDTIVQAFYAILSSSFSHSSKYILQQLNPVQDGILAGYSSACPGFDSYVVPSQTHHTYFTSNILYDPLLTTRPGASGSMLEAIRRFLPEVTSSNTEAKSGAHGRKLRLR